MNKDAFTKIINILDNHNFKKQAEDLESLVLQYYSESKENRKKIGCQIKQMCHPKWIGDLYVEGISQKEWFNLLDRLSRSI